MTTNLMRTVILGTALAIVAPGCGKNGNLEQYLSPTEFVNSDHADIVAVAQQLTAVCQADADKAKALFEYVRDSYTDADYESHVASVVLRRGGNFCRQRAILLAALCRAVGIPARLHLQIVTLRGWTPGGGETRDIVFAHGITGIHLNGAWHLYEPVGNGPKWVAWTQDPARAIEMPIQFHPDRDCLFTPEKGVEIRTLPERYADRTPEMIDLIRRIDTGRFSQ